MLNRLELAIIDILSQQKSLPKENIIIRLNFEQKNKNEPLLGYRAFKSIITKLESKSLILRLANNHYQLTSLGEQELKNSKLALIKF